MKILGITGSLHKSSLNTALLREAQKLAPTGVDIEVYVPDKLPLFNKDLEEKPPEEVILLRDKVRQAEALLFSTPEHNYTYPAALKNAIEWGSRPYGEGVWQGKVAAIIGASPMGTGTARAQHVLRQTFVEVNIFTFNTPEFLLSNMEEKFDDQGNLTDEKTKEKLKEMIVALVDFAKKFPSK